jgi:hypothetical protein
MNGDRLHIKTISPYHDQLVGADVLEPGSRW